MSVSECVCVCVCVCVCERERLVCACNFVHKFFSSHPFFPPKTTDVRGRVIAQGLKPGVAVLRLMRGAVEVGRATVNVEDRNVAVERLRVTVLGTALNISPGNLGQLAAIGNVSASLAEKGAFTQEFEKASVYVDALVSDGNPTSSSIEVDAAAGLVLTSANPLVVDIDAGVSIRARGTGRGQFVRAEWTIAACSSLVGAGLGSVEVKLPPASGAQLTGSTKLAVAGEEASLTPWNLPTSTPLDSFLLFSS